MAESECLVKITFSFVQPKMLLSIHTRRLRIGGKKSAQHVVIMHSYTLKAAAAIWQYTMVNYTAKMYNILQPSIRIHVSAFFCFGLYSIPNSPQKKSKREQNHWCNRWYRQWKIVRILPNIQVSKSRDLMSRNKYQIDSQKYSRKLPGLSNECPSQRPHY